MKGGSRRGLPTKRLSVLRTSKSGKTSLYQQNYRINPFEKDNSRSSNDGKLNPENSSKNKMDADVSLKENNKADQFSISMTQKSKMDSKQKLKDYVDNLTPVNGKIGGVAVNRIVSKVKSKNDMSQLKESYFNQIFTEGFFNDKNISGYKGLLQDTSNLINKLPANEHNYREISNSLINNKSNIAESAMVNMASAVSDRGLMAEVLTPSTVAISASNGTVSGGAGESYDKEEFRHDWFVKYLNPVNQLNTLYQDNSSDPSKSSVQNLYGLANDLDYIKNVPKLTDLDIKLWDNWINKNSTQIKSSLSSNKLYNTLLIEIDPTVASELYKTDKIIELPLYQSTFVH